MSEYQFYEFQTIDRRLSPEAVAEMKQLSSRVALTSSSATFVYNYGDFRGDADKVLLRHFDAMLYTSVWGSKQVQFRFPVGVIPDRIIETYQVKEGMVWERAGKSVILQLFLSDEEPDSELYGDGPGLLDKIVPLYPAILHGDYRGLYVGWLACANMRRRIEGRDAGPQVEPPVPAGLQSLDAPLKALARFLELPLQVVTAAGQASAEMRDTSAALRALIPGLPDAEKNAYLERVLAGEPMLSLALLARLREMAPSSDLAAPEGERRTLRQILDAAKGVRDQQREEARQKKAADHAKRMEKVAKVATAYWESILNLIPLQNAKAYEQAVDKLKDLHDLAIYQGDLAAFQARLRSLLEQYPTKKGLHNRVNEAKLLT